MKHIYNVYNLFRRYIKTDTHFFVLLSVVFVILRVPSLIEPVWYGDEGIYQVIGQGLRQGRLLYQEIWDNKPPFLYLIYALVNSDLYYVKLLSLIAGVLSLYPFFKLAQAFLVNRRAYWSATLFYGLLLALPIFEGNIANAENFMVLPILWGVYFFFTYLTTKDLVKLLLAGVIFSVALLFKIVAVFDIAAMMMVLLFINLAVTPKRFTDITLKRSAILKNITGRLRIMIPFLLSLSAVPLLVLIFFVIQGAGMAFISSVFSQNIGYVGVRNELFFPMGWLVLKCVLLVVSLGLLILYRKRIGFVGFFIVLWMIWSLFNAFFSQRPYTHYLLVLLPSLSLYIGYLFTKEWTQPAKLMLLIVLFCIVNAGFDFYTRILPYYVNYALFVGGGRDLETYQRFFDRSTPDYYAWAQFITSHTTPEDTIFYFGDSGQVYYLLNKLPPGRYIVAYHITESPETMRETFDAIQQKKPKYIIQAKNVPEFYAFTEGYHIKYVINNANIYEREF